MKSPAYDPLCELLYHLNFSFHMLEQELKNEQIWFVS